jgi:hypothetical protein
MGRGVGRPSVGWTVQRALILDLGTRDRVSLSTGRSSEMILSDPGLSPTRRLDASGEVLDVSGTGLHVDPD